MGLSGEGGEPFTWECVESRIGCKRMVLWYAATDSYLGNLLRWNILHVILENPSNTAHYSRNLLRWNGSNLILENRSNTVLNCIACLATTSAQNRTWSIKTLNLHATMKSNNHKHIRPEIAKMIDSGYQTQNFKKKKIIIIRQWDLIESRKFST